MRTFAYLPYGQQRSLELQGRLSDGILLLKLEAQGRLADYKRDPLEARAKRRDLADFVGDLVEQLRLYDGQSSSALIDLSFGGLIQRLTEDGNIHDQIDQLDRLQERLGAEDHPLPNQDYQLLDYLQRLLELETAEELRHLYRL